jgi:iron complex transport system substrate-binding protein
MKICSLLPSGTEILFALGLGDQVAGVSHECDFPPEARSKPVFIKSRISHTESAAAIDRQVREFLERGESLYSVDFELLRAIEPDIIVTQDLCHVCAATPDDLAVALAHLHRQPRVVTLNPHSLADVCADIRTLGEATGRCEQANAVVAEFERDIANVERFVAGLDRPRVLCLEWLDPPYAAGHWVPEMVERAGGVDVLGRQGKPSFRVDWETVLAARPEVIVIMPCGVSQSAVAARMEGYASRARWARVCRRGFRLFLAAWAAPGRRDGGPRWRDPRKASDTPLAVRIRSAARPRCCRRLIVSNEVRMCRKFLLPVLIEHQPRENQ